MAKLFSEHPLFATNFEPLRTECDAPDLVVDGELPCDINGTLLRNGPNAMYPPMPDYHVFWGDGMVHAFNFEEGRVSYRNRWVRTEKLAREQAAGHSLYGVMANPKFSAPEAIGTSYNVANTNVLAYGGRVLALEEYHAPMELDPVTLETRGPLDFGGQLNGPMTAHPRIDPESGNLHFFGHSVDGIGSTRLLYYMANPKGEIEHVIDFHQPYPSLLHDFVITQRYAVFAVTAVAHNRERWERGESTLAFDRSLPTHIAVVPHGGSAEDIRWFEGENCLVYHPMNAFEDGNKIIVDLHRYTADPGLPDTDGKPPRREECMAYLERWTIDLSAGTNGYSVERLDDNPGEFPRIDERFIGRPYRYGYYASGDLKAALGFQFNHVAQYDFATGRRSAYVLPKGDSTSEPIFVPRGEGEGNGYVMSVVLRAKERRSDVLVFDGQDVAAGPIAVAQLETRVPSGFHGNWMARS